MAHELQLIKHSSGILIPATPETSDLLQSKIKLGSVLVAEFRQVRKKTYNVEDNGRITTAMNY